MRFTAVIEQSGRTATGIPVPPEIVDVLGGGRRPAVTVTLGEFTYRTTVGSMGGRFMLPLSAERRAAARVAAGDSVEVDIALDDQPRVLEVPEEVQKALASDPAAKAAFDGLSYSVRLRHVLSVTGAKTPETRDRRISAMIEALGR